MTDTQQWTADSRGVLRPTQPDETTQTRIYGLCVDGVRVERVRERSRRSGVESTTRAAIVSPTTAGLLTAASEPARQYCRAFGVDLEVDG